MRSEARQELTDAELEASRMSFDEVRTALDDYRDQLLAARADSVAELKVDVRLLFGVLVAGLVLLMVSATLVLGRAPALGHPPARTPRRRGGPRRAG